MNKYKILKVIAAFSLAFALIGSPAMAFAQTPTGAISGTVRDANGYPITGVRIGVAVANGGGSYGPGTCTNSNNGTYTLGNLPLGSDIIMSAGHDFCGPNNFGLEYWQEIPGPIGDTPAGVTPIVLTGFSPNASGIDFTLDPVGTISGVVRDENGNPITGVAFDVHYLPVGGGDERGNCSDPISGAYTLSDLAFGSYIIWTGNYCGNPVTEFAAEYWQESANFASVAPVVVSGTNSNITGIDFTLQVTNETDTGSTYIYEFVESNTINADFWPEGIPMTLTIDDPTNGPSIDYTKVGTADTFGSFALMDEFTLAPGMIVTMTNGDMTKIHIVTNLVVEGTDSGTDRVSGSAYPYNLVWVLCEDQNGVANRYPFADSSGHWVADFSTPGPGAGEQELCNLSPGVGGFVIDGGGDLQNDFTMDTWDIGGSISGVVRDENGAPITGVSIAVFFSGNGYSDSACSNPATGAYSNNNLPFGSYVISASGNGVSCLPPGDNFAQEVWPNSPFDNGAVPVELTAANPVASGIDFTLAPEGMISGVVRDTNGALITGGRISIALNLADFSASTEIYTCTDANTGAFQLRSIPLGFNYKVSAVAFPCPNNLDGFAPVYAWPDSPTSGGGTTLTPTLATPDLTGIDFTLHQLGDTPAGNDVRTFALNSFITFDSVSVAGTTTVEAIETNPPPVPTNFQLLDTFYEVSTTATFDSAQVCFIYDDAGLTMEQENAIRLFHLEDNAWINVTDTGYPDTVNNVVCGTVTSFSPFAVMIPLDTTPPTITWVGNINDGDSFYFGFVPASPTCTADDPSGLDGPCTVTGHESTLGIHTLTATAQDTAGNVATESRNYTVLPWTLTGFYQPVDMNGVYNTVKGGSTVPLKFEVFAGPTELTDIAYIKNLTYAQIICNGSAITDEIETIATGGTSLRYTGGQFIYNWKTPKTTGCFRVTLTTNDGSSLVAYFKFK